jgi:lambda family phage minor tail protein L
MTIPYAEAQSLTPGGRVILYELDLSPLGVVDDPLRYLSPQANELGQPIIWGGHAYALCPIETEGFDLTSQGALPRPKVRVSNVTGLFTSLCQAHDDLIGARLTRRRVLVKHLPAENFASGVNPTADPAVCFEPEIWWVDQKTHESRLMIEWELCSPFDLQGVWLPRRQIVPGPCLWQYRSADCGYTGPGGWDANDNPVDDPEINDRCGLRVTSCKLRFPSGALPYGAFPGVGSAFT